MESYQKHSVANCKGQRMQESGRVTDNGRRAIHTWQGGRDKLPADCPITAAAAPISSSSAEKVFRLVWDVGFHFDTMPHCCTTLHPFLACAAAHLEIHFPRGTQRPDPHLLPAPAPAPACHFSGFIIERSRPLLN